MASLAASETKKEKKPKPTPEEALAAAEAKLAKLEAEVAAAEEALAASPDDGGLKKALKKLKKKCDGAKKGVKKAKKACKGNAWDNAAAGQSANAKKKKAAKAKKAAAEAAKRAAQEAWVNPTPAGQNKDVSGEIAKEYFPERVEAAWGEWWEARAYSRPMRKKRSANPSPSASPSLFHHRTSRDRCTLGTL